MRYRFKGIKKNGNTRVVLRFFYNLEKCIFCGVKFMEKRRNQCLFFMEKYR